MNKEEMYEFLENTLAIDTNFIDGAICVGGYNEDTLVRVLEYTTGYHSFEQYIECELGEIE